MKSLEKATADYEKAKEKMEASKARYEADLKRLHIWLWMLPFSLWLSHNLPLLFQDFSSLLLSGRLMQPPFLLTIVRSHRNDSASMES